MNIRPLLSILAPLFFYSALAEEETPQAVLQFPDGDAILGQAFGVDAKGHLLWSSPLLQQEAVPLLTKHLDAIHLANSSVPPTSDPEATITFQTHTDNFSDVLTGELLEFNDDTVRIRTWYAGELSLKRSMLRKVEVASAGPAMFSGPGRLTDWTQLKSPNPSFREGTKDAWSIENAKLVARLPGSLAREFPKLPDQFSLEFELAYERSPGLRLYFFADSGEEFNPRNSYSLTLQSGSVALSKIVDSRTSHLEEDVRQRRFDVPDSPTQKVQLFIDCAAGKFTLYVNGALMIAANDPTFAREHQWWHLSNLQNQKQTISNFTFRIWDGTFPEAFPEDIQLAPLPVKGEAIELQNGDTIIGKATTIEEGLLNIETEYAPIAVPIARLKSFQVTAHEQREEPRLYSADVRAFFHQGGHVTIRLSNLTSSHLSGYSQVFGDASFDLRAFSRIDFNPYQTEFRLRRGQPF